GGGGGVGGLDWRARTDRPAAPRPGLPRKLTTMARRAGPELPRAKGGQLHAGHTPAVCGTAAGRGITGPLATIEVNGPPDHQPADERPAARLSTSSRAAGRPRRPPRGTPPRA